MTDNDKTTTAHFSTATPKGPRLPKLKKRPPKLAVIIGATLLASFVLGILGSWVYVRYMTSGSARTQLEQSRNIVVNEESAIIDVAQNVSPSVVSITSSVAQTDIFGGTSNGTSSGTGIIVSTDGLILTNKHVVEGGTDFNVIVTDGNGKNTEYKGGRVVAKDPTTDIAFLRIDAKNLKAAQLGDSSKVKVGQRVIAIGNALGQFQNSVTTGIISGIQRPVTASSGDGGGAENLQNLFQTDAAINPGNSGGPLVNIDGQVIGINTAVAGNAQNIGFAIPINEARNDIVSVLEKGKIVRAYLGVRYVAVTPQLAASESLPVSEGALITANAGQSAVLSGSPADRAGLRDGDIITKVNDMMINKNNSLASILSSFRPGDAVTISYYRDGGIKTTKATLEEAQN
ncbi:trypsin-like peptidase domain-containing protein [bacterium]|nr:trypsin-like peptidase domain-containing protein [bacterium]